MRQPELKEGQKYYLWLGPDWTSCGPEYKLYISEDVNEALMVNDTHFFEATFKKVEIEHYKETETKVVHKKRVKII